MYANLFCVWLVFMFEVTVGLQVRGLVFGVEGLKFGV